MACKDHAPSPHFSFVHLHLPLHKLSLSQTLADYMTRSQPRKPCL